MAQPDLDAARYLQHGGRLCPVCQLEGVWHEHHRIDTVDVSNVRLLVMRCWCTRCNATWAETYRLVGVHRDRHEATEVERATYKPP
jgi:hypothetical protein